MTSRFPSGGRATTAILVVIFGDESQRYEALARK